MMQQPGVENGNRAIIMPASYDDDLMTLRKRPQFEEEDVARYA